MWRPVIACILIAGIQAIVVAERHAAKGMVLDVNPARRTLVASIEKIPGVMAAMTMPFEVKDARELEGIEPGMLIDFTFVVESSGSFVEGVRVRRYQGVEQDPLTARRLALFKKLATGRSAQALGVGVLVPDFTLTDSEHRPVTLSQLRGKLVAINFMYTTCQLPDFCVRVVNHFSVLQKRFKPELGRDLLLLTITFDPARDRPEVLNRYARQWNPDRDSWRFLTGSVPAVQRVLEMFGVSAFPNEGQMDHSLRTAFVARDGTLLANIEGNQYSSDQLVALTRTLLTPRPPDTATGR
jgi:protein SCO1